MQIKEFSEKAVKILTNQTPESIQYALENMVEVAPEVIGREITESEACALYCQICNIEVK